MYTFYALYKDEINLFRYNILLFSVGYMNITV